MKNSIALFLLLFICSFQAFATISEDFVKANEMYKQGNYTKAIEAYKVLIYKKKYNEHLYYNLGCAYLQSKDTSLSILYFEKALKENPTHIKSKNALNSLNILIPSQNTDLLKSIFLYQFFDNLFQNGRNNFSIFFIVCIWFFLFLLYYLIKTRAKNIVLLLGCVLFLLLSVLSLNLALHKNNFSKNIKTAIVLRQNTPVKSQDHLLAGDIHFLPKGTKIYIEKVQDNWLKIHMNDGSTAWIELKDVGMI